MLKKLKLFLAWPKTVNCLVRKVDPEDFGSALQEENQEFYGEDANMDVLSEVILENHWKPMLEKKQPADEIWFYRYPDEYWENMMGSQGYALVRKGKCIMEFRTKWN